MRKAKLLKSKKNNRKKTLSKLKKQKGFGILKRKNYSAITALEITIF